MSRTCATVCSPKGMSSVLSDSVDDGRGIGLEHDSPVADLVQGQHDDVQVLEDGALLHVLPQDLGHRLVHAVQDGH